VAIVEFYELRWKREGCRIDAGAAMGRMRRGADGGGEGRRGVGR
jgi:hypothetical protein